MIQYEYPLSERIRTLLRLEDLFDRFDAYAATPTPHAHHAALLTLFEMSEVAVLHQRYQALSGKLLP